MIARILIDVPCSQYDELTNLSVVDVTVDEIEILLCGSGSGTHRRICFAEALGSMIKQQAGVNPARPALRLHVGDVDERSAPT